MHSTTLKRHTAPRSTGKVRHTPQHDRTMAKNRLVKECDAIVRALALARDGHCVVCGSLDHLQVSHIYPKGKYPLMRFDLANVEIRCAGDHMYTKGSPHGDPAGFAVWLSRLPRKRMVYLQRQADHIGKADILWLRQTYQDLLAAYERTFGMPWQS